ncbi:hypothetical protein EMCRGX_G020249 [Ephydatia muelleri]|eukprot:Em0016g182a
MLPLLLVALYTTRKEQHGPIPTTRANVEQHQDPATPQQESSSQLRYSDQEYEADDHCRLNQCLKVPKLLTRQHYFFVLLDLTKDSEFGSENNRLRIEL